jgi:hypothetical protein
MKEYFKLGARNPSPMGKGLKWVESYVKPPRSNPDMGGTLYRAVKALATVPTD